jgi:hypothetical protein
MSKYYTLYTLVKHRCWSALLLFVGASAEVMNANRFAQASCHCGHDTQAYLSLHVQLLSFTRGVCAFDCAEAAKRPHRSQQLVSHIGASGACQGQGEGAV